MKGFTLVEILVVIAITALVGVILVVIFANTLRGSNKSQILAVIKQNGQAVLDNIDKQIRSADKIICATADTLVIVKNNTYTRFKFVLPAGAANGYIEQDSPVPPAGDISAFLISVCTDLVVGANILTDTNTKTGVSLENGLFTRNPSPGFKDAVSVEFILKPGVEADAQQIDPVKFQTTVQLR